MVELLTVFGALALVRVAYALPTPHGLGAIGVAAVTALLTAQVAVNPSLVAAGAVWCAAALWQAAGATTQDRGLAASLGVVGVAALLASGFVPPTPGRAIVYGAILLLGPSSWLRMRTTGHTGVIHHAAQLLRGVTVSLLCMFLYRRAGMGWAETLSVVVGGAVGWMLLWPQGRETREAAAT